MGLSATKELKSKCLETGVASERKVALVPSVTTADIHGLSAVAPVMGPAYEQRSEATAYDHGRGQAVAAHLVANLNAAGRTAPCYRRTSSARPSEYARGLMRYRSR